MTSSLLTSLPPLDLIHQELARRELIRFTLYTKPDYLAGWFHIKLAKALDKFLDDVINKRSPRLMIFAPPRHGKSELTSKRFPAYALGKYPDLTFIGTSWGADLASAVNRDIQRIIDSEEYAKLFPGTRLWGKNIRTVADGSYLRNSDIFEVVNRRGQYKSSGRGGGIAGRGGDILLMDDVVKDAEEASSPVVRAATWEWYVNDLYTRLMPGAGILFIMTRRHQDDIAGHLLANMKKDGEKWDVINFPAIAEEDEFDEDGTLLRRAGEALHPERYSEEMLQRIKVGTADAVGVGSKVWASLYQQRPSAAAGNMFKRENWGWYKPLAPFGSLSPQELHEVYRDMGFTNVIQRWDTALGLKKQNDFTACTTLGVAKNRYYVLDVWKGQLEFPDVKRQVKMLYDKWKPRKVYVEGGGSASGKATVQATKRDSAIPIFESITATDKVLRADTVTPSHEAGLILLPEGEWWIPDFIDQCANFPDIKNDDDVDSFIGAMEEVLNSRGPMEITDELLQLFA
jgi:predicted phage terminase large subunit-like protein